MITSRRGVARLSRVAVQRLQQGWVAGLRYLLFSWRPPPKPTRILLLRTARLGDFINAVPAMAAVRRQFPTARIVLMTAISSDRAMVRRTLEYASAESLPWLEFVQPHLVDSVCVLPEHRQLALKRGRACVQEEPPDLAYLIPYGGESCLSKVKKLVFLRAIGLRCALYGWRLGATRQDWKMDRTFQVRHQALVALDGVLEHPRSAARPEALVSPVPLAIPRAAREWAVGLWQTQGWDSGVTVVALHPGASFPHKVWPKGKFLEVCRSLIRASPVCFAVIGGAGDRALGQSLADEIGGRCCNLTGATSIVQLAALLERCRLFLGNDGGPAHLAAAVGCACVTIMSGIEPPGLWDPLGQAAGVVRHVTPCSPCFSFTHCPLGTETCVREITVDAVLERCQALVSRWAGRTIVQGTGSDAAMMAAGETEWR